MRNGNKLQAGRLGPA